MNSDHTDFIVFLEEVNVFRNIKEEKANATNPVGISVAFERDDKLIRNHNKRGVTLTRSLTPGLICRTLSPTSIQTQKSRLL